MQEMSTATPQEPHLPATKETVKGYKQVSKALGSQTKDNFQKISQFTSDTFFSSIRYVCLLSVFFQEHVYALNRTKIG